VLRRRQASTADRYTLSEGVNILTVTKEIDQSDRTTIRLDLVEVDAQLTDSFLYIDALIISQNDYFLPWHIGGSTRANPVKQITLPEALPDTFGIGLSAKMLHAHDAADRTFWECGGYRCYFDSSDNKLKMTNGVVTAETAAVSWGQRITSESMQGGENGNLFIQAKIAGVVGDKAEQAGGRDWQRDNSLRRQQDGRQ